MAPSESVFASVYHYAIPELCKGMCHRYYLILSYLGPGCKKGQLSSMGSSTAGVLETATKRSLFDKRDEGSRHRRALGV